MAAGDYAAMRASDDDRSRVQAHLNEAFAEGRLDQQEWDGRATALGSAQTYGDLDKLTADLPQRYIGTQLARPQPERPLQQRTSGLATAALVCGLGQLVIGFPAGIAAIILGHKARRRIRQTGEQGDGLAVAGLILGYLGVVGLVLIGLLLAVVVARPG